MRNIKIYLVFVTVCLMNSFIYANDYPVSAIADSLKIDAVAVVRDYSIVFTQSNLNNATYTVTEVTTILNKQGDYYAHFRTYGDKSRELSSFSGIVRDASGKIIRKIKKGDLIVSSISEGSTMASDSYSISYECQHLSYPFTVEYSYQVKIKNGVISYPSFSPVGFQESLERAEFKLELPLDINLRKKSNYACNIQNEKIVDKNIYSLSLIGLKARKYEVLAPSFREILPRVLFAPSDFCYDSHCGNMSTWGSYAEWVSKLLKDRDILSADLVAKLQAMTKDAKDDREKVRIIYEYMQNHSRYVSIQMGIGGLQPAAAMHVAKNGFGDCKGLSNLMKAMLKAVDIPSNYCEISMTERELYPDFANVSQTDHAILLVPLKGDSIWLECTSQTLPFGFVHDDIAGHTALVISEDGTESKLCRLPVYTDKQNNKETILVVDIHEDGQASGHISFVEHLHGYVSAIPVFNSKDRDKMIKYINTYLKLPHIEFSGINATENKASLPSCRLDAAFQAPDYGNKTGNRLFLPLCPLHKGTLNMFSAESRTWDIVMQNGFSETDSIVFNLPESYTLETLPKDVDINTPFGSLKTKTEQKDNQIIYTQYLDIYSTRHSKESYKEVKDFFAQISTTIKRKLVLRKI
ncbi:DUF3857 and transglutaminase domain-containing protein [Dysgonomonas sp. ZJ709]|uniref:DUF3857 domain-containing transglutaminase family protein n=1 Tax=Dysgonomonas sp. ZJ709 TaxID=2709797 RepID=UPI002105DA74|nr:DUF3857 and transglutaminase domain-containing protein [Dysgonomonas sp. ZJ709]